MMLQMMITQELKGPEKRGYVRLVGRMPGAKGKGDSSTDSQTIHELTSVVSVMANIIQEHILNANLSAILSNMNLQVPGIVSSVSNNSSSVNQSSPSRSHNNNGKR